jgi:hypothetical protein
LRNAQEIGFINCFSRLATRCLMLRVDSPHTKKAKKASKKLPGEPMPEEERLNNDEPFSDSEEDLNTMDPAHHKLYMELKGYMDGNHASEMDVVTCYGHVGEKLVNKCFQVAVERLMPGSGDKFELCIAEGGEYGKPDEEAGAKDEMAYIQYLPATCYAGGGLDVPRGGVSVPWGCKMTPVSVLDRAERVQVDAAFAVLLDKLGLVKVGEPGLKQADLGRFVGVSVMGES